MRLDATRMPGLLDDLDLALHELVTPFERDPDAWHRGPSGKWKAGQHVDHVAASLALSAGAFERAASELAAGRLGARPWRDPVQALFVRIATGRRFPRGGRARAEVQPVALTEPDEVFARLTEGAGRHRAIHERLTPGDRDRIWIRNPFAPAFGWHYTLPEMVRVHTTHARHHGRLIAEALRA